MDNRLKFREQSVNDWNTNRQNENEPYHMWVYCNYQKKKKQKEKERTFERVDERWLIGNWEGVSQGIEKVREV